MVDQTYYHKYGQVCARGFIDEGFMEQIANTKASTDWSIKPVCFCSRRALIRFRIHALFILLKDVSLVERR